MDLKTLQQLQTDIEELLGLLDFGSVEPTVEVDADEILRVELKSETAPSEPSSDDSSNLGILIGPHGETLAAFEYLLALMLNRNREEWLRVQVDIDGYRQKRTASLVEVAHKMAERALSSGNPVALYPMSSYERRIIHTTLTDKSDVVTESTGTGRQRHVVVKPA